MRTILAIGTLLLISAAQPASLLPDWPADSTHLIGSEPPSKVPPTPADDKWTFAVSGTIELICADAIDLAAFMPYDSLAVELEFHWREPEDQAGRWEAGTFAFNGALDRNGYFRVDCTTWREVWPEDGTWNISVRYHGGSHRRHANEGFTFPDRLIAQNLQCRSTTKGFELGTQRPDIQSLMGPDHQVVVGKLIDPQDNPIAHSWEMELAFADGDRERLCSLATDSNGQFLSTAWDAKERLSMTPNRKLELRFGYIGYNDDWPGVGYPIKLPEVGEAVVNFGTIQLQRGVVRVSASLAPHADLEVQRLAELCGLHESGVYFNVQSQPSRWAGGAPLQIPYGESPACFWLPEGEYHYYATRQSSAFSPTVFGRVHGVVSVPLSGVVHLKLHMDQGSFVALHLTTNSDGLIGAEVRWTILRDGVTLAEGLTANQGWVAVPTYPGATTRVHVSGYNLISQVVNVLHGQGPLEVELLPNDRDCRVEIVPPDMPPGLTVHELSGQVKLSCRDTGMEYWPEWSRWSNCWVDRVHAGTFDVILMGGQNYGYESGRLTAPITIQSTPNALGRFKLPAVGPPPWKYRAKSFAPITAKCGDNFVGVAARGTDTSYDEGDWRGDVYVGLPNGEHSPRAGPIRDGNFVIPITTVPPSEHEGIAAPTLNLPVRVVAKLHSFSRLYGKLSVKISQPLTDFGSNGTWEGRDISLWVPAGASIVEVSAVPSGLLLARQHLTVTANEPVIYAPESEKLREVFFKVAERATPAKFTWTLYRRNEEQVEYCLGDVGPGEKHLLVAGHYALVRSDDSDKPILFVVPPDKDVAVEMRLESTGQAPRSLQTHLLLKFELGQGEYQSAEFECYTYRGDAVHMGNPIAHRYPPPELQSWRVTRTGVWLLDSNFVEGSYLTGFVRVLEDGKPRTRLMQPLKIRLDAFQAMPDGTHSVDVRLLNATRLADDWPSGRVYSLSIVDGCPVPANGALPRGRHKLAVAGLRSYRLLEVEVPDQPEPFSLPDAVAKAAREVD